MENFTDTGASDSVTVLTWEGSRRLSKTFARLPDGTFKTESSYPRAKDFCHDECPVDGIRGLYDVLQSLQTCHHSCVIAGKHRGSVDQGQHLRRSKADFEDSGKRWVIFDLDKEEIPQGFEVEDLRSDPENIVETIIHDRLPGWCHDVSCVAQLSSSAGLELTNGKNNRKAARISLHIWFWLDRPVTCFQWKAYWTAYKESSGHSPVDLAVFQTVQPIYTAPPTFANCDDPYPQRVFFLDREHDALPVTKLDFSVSVKSQPAGGCGASTHVPFDTPDTARWRWHLDQIGLMRLARRMSTAH